MSATYVTPQRRVTKKPLTPSPASQAPSPAKRRSKGPLIFAGVAVYCSAAYGFYLYYSLSRSSEKTASLVVPDDVSYRYNETAEHFDQDVNLTEKLMGLGWLRKSLLSRATGHVLETSVGTGRNAKYYKLNCQSVTVVDQSAEMLKIARKRFQEERPQLRNIRFLNQSAQDPIPSPSPAGFDTVVQTMGLCSTPNPADVLRNLGKATNPNGGQILLLEHGRSHYAWLNRILDNTASAHADRHGCWWNRDIGKIVEDSGLEVDPADNKETTIQ
ncbi:hypothetical protein MMC25_001128 [Agyrium rufum]|nr:hypothetical protein [Agyrium rufum]